MRGRREQPDLDAVRSSAELAAAPDGLREARGLSYADLEKAARPDRLPKSTISNMLTRSRPGAETLELFLHACDFPCAQWPPWQAARKRALLERAPAVPGAVRVSKAVVRGLGVL
ncbi:hypothetical protein Mame01_63380 [Microbispora amethystogenes]|nr:hypothetical protein Mame01_63380 [Microbispora amethystogenes]